MQFNEILRLISLKDFTTLLIAVASLCVAMYAVWMSKKAINTQLHIEKWSANHDFLLQATRMLSENPKLLDVHGISEEELMKDGLTPEEFVYVYIHLDAASALYRLGRDKKVVLTDFRKGFLREQKVILLWEKYLRDKMFATSSFKDEVNRYINEIKQKDNS